MFNSNSRWDRSFPNDEHETGEPIEVGVVFRQGKLIPTCFVYQGRKYKVKEVTYHWQEQRGNEALHFFTVTDGSNLYQIHLNSKYMYWRLDRQCPL